MSWQKFLFGFRGRIGRADFWSLAFAAFGAWFLAVVAANVPTLSAVRYVLPLALFVLGIVIWLSASVRRLHDRDKSAWYLLLFFGVPSFIQTYQNRNGLVSFTFFSGGTNSFLSLISLAIGIWMIVELGCLPGTSGPNGFGPSPLEENAKAVP